MKRNRHPKACELCRKNVEAGVGWLVNGPPWEVYHEECYKLHLNGNNTLLEFDEEPVRPVHLPVETWDKLYPYQKTGVDWLLKNSSGVLGDQMGLGKTIQAILAITGRAVVVCPSFLKHNWYQEIKKWRDDLEPIVLEGRGSFRWPVRNEVIITNYEILPPMTGDESVIKTPVCGNAPAGVTLIGDEGHAFKTYKARRTKRWRALAFKAQNVWLLTGTPMLNNPVDLWGVLKSARVERIAFNNWDRYMHLFGGRNTRFGVEWGNPSPEVKDRLSSVVLRRTRTEVMPELPTKTYQWHHIELPDSFWLEEAEALGELDETLAKLGLSYEDLALLIENDKLKPTDIGGLASARKTLAAVKTEQAVKLIEQYESNNEPLIVFGAHVAPAKFLGSRSGWGCITGDTPNEERAELVGRFQEGDLRGLACTIRAAGVGLTLTHACHAIFIDLDWVPAINEQAEDRICRIGQERGCVITRVISDHRIDMAITKALARKGQLIAEVGL